MSDLVEKVAMAMNEVQFGNRQVEYENEARAAIRAVLAHFAEAGNISEKMVAAGWGDYHESVGTGRKVLAATFRAALKEMEG